MDRKGYYRIIKAVLDLLFVILVEAGKVTKDAAGNVVKNIYKTLTGGDYTKQ